MRITGGFFRSRTLRAPRGAATRPTSDRVREALFSILCAGGTLEGASVLDLYAGTGALGLEALSRGAARAVFVERAREAARVLRQNVSSLGVGEKVRVHEMSVERAAAALDAEDRFDIVLADPPYADVASGAASRALAAIVSRGVLAERGRFVLEHAVGDPAPALLPLVLGETRRYGDTAVSLYARKDA